MHPDYEDTGTFDAALIHTTTPIDAPTIALAPLGNDELEQGGAALTVAGWGTEFFGSPVIPSRLKSVDVQAVADEDCTTNETQGFAADSEICAETLGGDSCQGDSGGPLFGTLADGRRVQVGIVSLRPRLRVPRLPGRVRRGQQPVDPRLHHLHHRGRVRDQGGAVQAGPLRPGRARRRVV